MVRGANSNQWSRSWDLHYVTLSAATSLYALHYQAIKIPNNVAVVLISKEMVVTPKVLSNVTVID